MPDDELHQTKGTLWSYMQESGQDPAQLQDFLKSNNISIDLKTHEGFENILRVGGGTNDLNSKEDCDFFFGGKDMKDMTHDTIDKRTQLHMLMNAMKGIYPNEEEKMKVYVFKDGESTPRELSFDKDKKSYNLSGPVAEPEPPPKKPSLWQRFAHAVFGAYKEEFENYERAKARYNSRKDFITQSANQRQERIKNGNTQRHAEYQGKNQDAIEEQLGMDAKTRGTTRQNILTELQSTMDKAFGNIEQLSHGQINREDHVMINGKTLHTLMVEDYARGFNLDGRQGFEAVNNQINNLWEKMPDAERQSRMNEILMDAMLKGQNVRFMHLDPVSGVPQPDGTGKLLQKMELPESMRNLDDKAKASLNRVSDESVQIDYGKSDLNEIRKCDELMQRNNYVKRVFINHSQASYVRDQYFLNIAQEKGKTIDKMIQEMPHLAGLTKDRGALTTHAMAKLMVDGMSMKDLTDPAKFPEKKEAAGREVIEHFLNRDLEWFAKVNMGASPIFQRYISDHLQNVNFMDDKALFSPENETALEAVYTLFDLQQEADHFDVLCQKALAEQNGLDISKPEDAIKAKELREEMARSTRVLSSMKWLTQGEKSAVDLAMETSLTKTSTAIADLFVGEMCRSRLQRNQANKRPMDQFLENAMDAMLLDASPGVISSHEAAQGGGLYTDMQKGRDLASCHKNGMAALNGNIRKTVHMDYRAKADGDVELTFVKRPEAVKESQTPQKVRTTEKGSVSKAQTGPGLS